MATIRELTQSLPPQIVYCGVVYHLNWSFTQYDRRCVQMCYRNEYDEILAIDEDFFFAECERHYATYIMLQLLLYYAEVLLSYIYYQNRDAYIRTVQSMYANSLTLQEYCTVNSNTSDSYYGNGQTTVIL